VSSPLCSALRWRCRVTWILPMVVLLARALLPVLLIVATFAFIGNQNHYQNMRNYHNKLTTSCWWTASHSSRLVNYVNVKLYGSHFVLFSSHVTSRFTTVVISRNEWRHISRWMIIISRPLSTVQRAACYLLWRAVVVDYLRVGWCNSPGGVILYCLKHRCDIK